MAINEITKSNFPKVVALLKQNKLPTGDISELTKLFSISDNDRVGGTVGLESYKSIGLLRSLTVDAEYRSKGLGRQLIDFIENFAKQNGIQEMVLLTTTASDYFSKRNYEVIQRENVPKEIKKSTEFTSTCPSSAIIMKKIL